MRKKLLLTTMLCLILSMSACGTKSVPVSDVSTDVTPTAPVVSAVEETSTETEISEDPVVEETETDGGISQKELEKITKFIQEPYNYGFLMSTYADVRDVDMLPIFYNGDVYNDIPEEESKALWKELGETEGGSLTVISRDEIERVLGEKTGYESLDDFNHFYNFWIGNWRFSSEYNSYYRCVGDINYEKYEAVSGYTTEDGLLILRVHQIDENAVFVGNDYDDLYKELALEPVGDSYHFVSCRQLIDENLIMDNCYQITVNGLGDCLFFTYDPATQYGDVTFRVIYNGEVYQTLYSGKETNTAGDHTVFEKILDMGFCDYNNDGYTDMIYIGQYTDKDGKTKIVEKVYSGNDEGYFYYIQGLNEFVNSERTPSGDFKTELAFLQDQNLYAPDWRSVYINILNSKSDEEWGVEESTYGGGFTLISVDDDSIPEMSVYGSCEAYGSKLITYENGNGAITDFVRLYFSYMPEYGLLNNSEGHMGYYFDDVYKVENSCISSVAYGNYGGDFTFNDEGEMIEDFDYSWMGKDVTEEEYWSELAKVYDEKNNYTKYVRYDRVLSRENFIKLLNCEYSKYFE